MHATVDYNDGHFYIIQLHINIYSNDILIAFIINVVKWIILAKYWGRSLVPDDSPNLDRPKNAPLINQLKNYKRKIYN